MADLGAMRVKANNIEGGREVHVVLDPLGQGPEEIVLTARWEASGALAIHVAVASETENGAFALELLDEPEIWFGSNGPEVT